MAGVSLMALMLAGQAQPETGAPPPPEPMPEAAAQPVDPATLQQPDNGLIDGRRRPGVIQRVLPDKVTQDNPGAVRAPPPEAFPANQFPVPDRWRLIETLGLVKQDVLDPYHQNTYKGDRPLCLPTDEEQERRREAGQKPCRTPKFLGLSHEDWFFTINAASDTVVEPRSFPIPVGNQTTSRPDSNDTFGRPYSLVLSQTFIGGFSLSKGYTAYKPPEIEYRVSLAYNLNYVQVPERRVLFVQPSKPPHRFDQFLGVQELFIDKHIRNTSDRYDFDSIRIGIQPFQSDFRGFLFNDQQLGIRLFGNRDNNRFQYNLAAFWRLEKDTNSGLNSVVNRPRDDFVFVANAYLQDFPVPGFTSQGTVVYNMNREQKRIEVDDNGFPVRPALLGDLRGREYDVVYVGYNGDGHFGRLNLTVSAYGAFGEDRNSFFTSQAAKIEAYFAAAEASMDFDWIRVRLSGLYASGDKKPYNNVEGGFDAIFENPIFAGADTSYYIRQSIPFAGGGRAVVLSGRNALLNDLRSSKEQGQSNFNNPGTALLGVGADFDLTPTTRLTLNANHLWFANTATLQALRVEGSIPNSIGFDLSAAATWRPKANQNLVFRLSGALLQPGAGFKDLFASQPRDHRFYSVLLNAIVTY
ncbi:hypothetical protein ACFSCW_07445 [Sphingomonas tabacisoli]|uniref:Alginate export domain-containing protein n=1 Tax=Sphingomonas tabacisoli TaxID=2249466 RepID=A0ABW4I3C6_9SPHN